MPTKPSDFPVSYHRKNGKLRARSLGPQHLKQFDWLAVSRVEGVDGAWCAFCALFKTSKEGGGHVGMHGVGGNVTMGRLVNQPLRDFSDLTGRNGCLSKHGLTEFHKASAVRVAEFVSRSQSQSKPTDVRTVISKARQQETHETIQHSTLSLKLLNCALCRTLYYGVIEMTGLLIRQVICRCQMTEIFEPCYHLGLMLVMLLFRNT